MKWAVSNNFLIQPASKFNKMYVMHILTFHRSRYSHILAEN